MKTSRTTLPDIYRSASNRALVEAAAAGFEGNRSELARATGIPVRTLINFADGTNRGSAALIFALRVLATNTERARRLCLNAAELGAKAPPEGAK